MEGLYLEAVSRLKPEVLLLDIIDGKTLSSFGSSVISDGETVAFFGAYFGGARILTQSSLMAKIGHTSAGRL